MASAAEVLLICGVHEGCCLHCASDEYLEERGGVVAMGRYGLGRIELSRDAWQNSSWSELVAHVIHEGAHALVWDSVGRAVYEEGIRGEAFMDEVRRRNRAVASHGREFFSEALKMAARFNRRWRRRQRRTSRQLKQWVRKYVLGNSRQIDCEANEKV